MIGNSLDDEKEEEIQDESESDEYLTEDFGTWIELTTEIDDD